LTGANELTLLMRSKTTIQPYSLISKQRELSKNHVADAKNAFRSYFWFAAAILVMGVDD
jgi:hypothetical protein